jgi:hypothetical protein
MDINKRIEKKKKDLYSAISAKGIMSNDVLVLSEELDVLIVERMRRSLA